MAHIEELLMDMIDDGSFSEPNASSSQNNSTLVHTLRSIQQHTPALESMKQELSAHDVASLNDVLSSITQKGLATTTNTSVHTLPPAASALGTTVAVLTAVGIGVLAFVYTPKSANNSLQPIRRVAVKPPSTVVAPIQQPKPPSISSLPQSLMERQIVREPVATEMPAMDAPSPSTDTIPSVITAQENIRHLLEQERLLLVDIHNSVGTKKLRALASLQQLYLLLGYNNQAELTLEQLCQLATQLGIHDYDRVCAKR
jgi:hypothetical protein